MAEENPVTVPGLLDSTVDAPDTDTACTSWCPRSAPLQSLAEASRHLLQQGVNLRKLPVRLEVVGEIPRNALAKVVKNDLIQRF
ncbi:hypothetical protein [Rhodococcus artemisiae]|uniref:AMP-binding enzyme n=1 Tax=Rhodococcus artemisiae TaxID=714159 RepID=A0ABU7LCH3_9NOCA|nr:hypothetical protein [Rhodococcus artemisiae]MEE2059251.1 hypothetical protein [Rhodococcus artemisiae]